MREGAWDWDAYWGMHAPPRDQVLAGRRMARRIQRFLRKKGLDARRIADVGCGPATTLFALAPRMPGCAFVGFDASRVVLRLDRQRARREGLRNLRFRHAALPSLEIHGGFDLVLCIATLHYVRDVRRALRRLHGIVRPGGYLIFNYPNRVQQAAIRRDARTDEVVARRFRLALSGANLLTREMIADTLRARPRSFWREVGEQPKWLNPCAVVARR